MLQPHRATAFVIGGLSRERQAEHSRSAGAKGQRGYSHLYQEVGGKGYWSAAEYRKGQVKQNLVKQLNFKEVTGYSKHTGVYPLISVRLYASTNLFSYVTLRLSRWVGFRLETGRKDLFFLLFFLYIFPAGRSPASGTVLSWSSSFGCKTPKIYLGAHRQIILMESLWRLQRHKLQDASGTRGASIKRLNSFV